MPNKKSTIKIFLPCLLNLLWLNSFGQSAQDIIKKVYQAQKTIRNISYTLVRTDTLVTGDNRTMSGKVLIETDPADNLFGFKFWSKKDNDVKAKLYDGHLGYEINPDTKTYVLETKPSGEFLVNGGGQIILRDLVKLDTAKSIDLKLSEDTGSYYLTMTYDDIKAYFVIKRHKIVTISKKTMLPTAMRLHQETLGKVQDLYYQIKDIAINDIFFTYNFSSPDFLKDYQQKILVKTNSPVATLINKQAPAFNLASFDGDNMSTSQMPGKVVLLDFWEVWCGPCMAAMPNVERLYDTYKDKGLQVYGIINDIKQIEPSRLLAKNKKFKFPTLIGNPQLKNDYKLIGVPLYILIDKNGKVIFEREGYSDEIETAIKAAIL